tara:strand:- start:264 stop:2534 length:2271 start_codon:yes stop_codon:yes gene_type:complete
MKVKHYNEMMAYLTRPGFNGGGAVSNRTVLPKRKPAAEVKRRKKINYEKIKQYLGKESQELIERELGFAMGGDVDTPKRGLVDEPGSYAGNPLFGKEITGKMQEGKIFGKNKERLDKLKKIIQESNGSYKKNITAHEALVKAGWKDGYQSIGTTQKIRSEVAKAMEKLSTTQEKIDNYINNVMLAEDAVVKDFKSPQQHIAKKFGVSKSFMDKWAVKSKVYQENKKLFTGLRNELSFNKYKTLPDGTPRSIAEYSEIIQNKLPYKQSFFRGDSREKFIMDSAYRHHKYAKDAGKSSQIRFIGNPELMPINQWQFIKGDKLYSLDPALDNVVYQGTTYKNNYLNRADAANLYKNDFGEVYKAFDDLDVYMNTMVEGPDGKPIKLDTLLRRKAFDETGKEDFLRRRFAEIDHDDIMKKPFSDLRLLDRQTNARAGIINRLNKYKNNPELRNKTLTDIGYLNRDKDINAFIKRMTNKVGARKPTPVILGSNLANIDSDLLDFRKLPGDVKNVSDVIRDLIKTPGGKRIARNLIKAGKFTGLGFASELAFAAPFAADDYASGLSGDRIKGNILFADATKPLLQSMGFSGDIVGQTADEEIRKAVGERGYATQTISELGERLPVLQQQYEALNDQNDPGGLNRDKLAKIYNRVSTEYNNAYDLFVTDRGEFDKELYNQAVTNYAAGLGQIEKFRAAKEKERGVKEASKNVTGFELDLGFAGGGIAKQAGDESGKPPESGPTPDGPSKGLAYLFKNGMEEEE